jgi:beta-glucosidase/6-phospho-beta-glucosidase/beta-galactosidase
MWFASSYLTDLVLLFKQVDALLEAGIQPCITIFHWDHHLALETRYGSSSLSTILSSSQGSL